MSSPLSPRSFPTTSFLGSGPASPPPSAMSFPSCPIEVQKRILHFALSLSPPHPSSRQASKHVLAGQTARQRELRRVVERLAIHRSALTLMRVCKAWKKEAAGYLYAEPHLTPSNLFLFAHALKQGDKKWSDINLHPHSVPGRYVTSLDLTHLRDGYDTPHPTALLVVLREIFPLVPNLQYLKLSSGTYIPIEEIRRAPFARRLKSLEGVQVGYDITLRNSVDPIVRLLRGLPALEVLSLIGPGEIDAPAPHELDEARQDPLQLDRLHTLVLSGVKSGLALHTLLSSDLPALRNLVVTSYANCVGDLTYPFQSAHCDKLTSVTYIHPRGWPGLRALPPAETLELHPNLERLAYLLPKDLSHLESLFERVPANHPLRALTIPKWTSNPAERWDPGQAGQQIAGTGATQMMTTLLASPPSHLAEIVIDGFRWVRADIGMRALQTGDSGEMRGWAEKFQAAGVALLDMDRKPPTTVGSIALAGTILESKGKGRRRSSAQWIETMRVPRDKLDEDGG